MNKTMQWIATGIGISLFAAAAAYAGTPTVDAPPSRDVVNIAPQHDEVINESGSIIITTYYADASHSGPPVGSCVRNTCPDTPKGLRCTGVKTQFSEIDTAFCDGDGPK